jgi:hypothetical protein
MSRAGADYGGGDHAFADCEVPAGIVPRGWALLYMGREYNSKEEREVTEGERFMLRSVMQAD